MKRKLFILGMTIVMALSGTVMAYAESNIPTENETNNTSIRSNRDKIVKEYVRTSSGTETAEATSKRGKLKVEWTEKYYKVYYENVSTGVKRFQYHEYHWSWTGYEQKGNAWEKKKSSSGTSREHLDPKSYMAGLL